MWQNPSVLKLNIFSVTPMTSNAKKQALSSADYLSFKGILNVENYPFYRIIQIKTLSI